MRWIVFFVMLMTCTTGFTQSKTTNDIDHAAILKKLDNTTLEKGKKIYTSACMACHGTDGTASLPQARSFNKDKMRFGTKPYDMWQTITKGSGAMPAQSWLTPQERYFVIQYIRETFMKDKNPTQYFSITANYLGSLPKADNAAQQKQIVRNEALKGNIKYGQDWFSNNAGNYGTAIYSQLKGYGTSMLTIKLSATVYMSYDIHRMGSTALWKGSLNLSETKYRKYRGEGQPEVKGQLWEGLDTWQWTYNEKLDSLRIITGIRTPLPKQYLQYHGHYTNGNKVILSYAVSGRNVLEMPTVLHNNSTIVHTLHIAPGAAQSIYIGKLPNSLQERKNDLIVLTDTVSKKFVAAAFISKNKELQYTIDKEGRILLSIPESNEAFTVQVLRTNGKNAQPLNSFKTYVQSAQKTNRITDLTTLIEGGTAQWITKVKTVGKLYTGKPHFDPIYSKDEDKTSPSKAVNLPDNYPYAVDDIPLPFNNPWNAWVRPTSLGFKKNGDLVLATYTGDVWIASGIDSTLKNVRWQRSATGLYEPMGLKVVDDNIYVTCRNGIVLLHDLNNDGETDFYQNFYADHDVSSFFHAFNFGLETDEEGNFYYAKVGAFTDNKAPGSVVKISKNGDFVSHLGSGFRTNNGITVTPDKQIFVSDNQGNWIPGNKINWVQPDGFYGYVPNQYHEGQWSPDGKVFTKEQGEKGTLFPHIVPVPSTFDQPALWIPQEFDNSPGGGTWSHKEWGPLGDRFIHSSFGRGWLYTFYPQEIDGTMQGAMVALPFQFDAGIQRVAVNPVDKQIYTTGLTGWDDGIASGYGTLARVRYTGKDGELVTGVQTVKGGIQLTFNCELDVSTLHDTSKYRVTQYNYKWTKAYGSDHYSIRTGEKGEDTLSVQRITLGADGRSITAKIDELGAAQTVCFRFEVKTKSGKVIKDVAYLTIHKMPE